VVIGFAPDGAGGLAKLRLARRTAGEALAVGHENPPRVRVRGAGSVGHDAPYTKTFSTSCAIPQPCASRGRFRQRHGLARRVYDHGKGAIRRFRLGDPRVGSPYRYSCVCTEPRVSGTLDLGGGFDVQGGLASVVIWD
jgi:hypothetical protein